VHKVVENSNDIGIGFGFVWGSLQKVSYVVFVRPFWSYGHSKTLNPKPLDHFQRQLKNNYFIFQA
jgi:hypothetical protein